LAEKLGGLREYGAWIKKDIAKVNSTKPFDEKRYEKDMNAYYKISDAIK